MLDTLLDVGCAFDWITPTLAFIQDFLNGPVSHFGISAYIGWDRSDIKRLLKSYGVRVWGLMYNFSGDMLMFTVPKTQARWAYYLLQREGVPILYAPKEAVYLPKTTTAPDPLDSVFKFLDKLEQDFD